MSKNLVDVFLTTYNGEKYLSEQLESLFTQTVQTFKIIIRDDGSKDKTIKIIRKYQNKYKGKIIFINDNLGNLGSSKSFMYLLEYNESDFVMFCDQDDVWLPNKIELSINKIKELESKYTKNTPLLVFTDLKVVDHNLKTIEESFWTYQKILPDISKEWKKLLAQNVVTGCTIIMNKSAKKYCLPFDLDKMIHDQWIAVNIAKFGKIEYLKNQTILYRQHENNVEGAHLYGFRYLFGKIYKIKESLVYYKEVACYFQNCQIHKLLITKVIINFIRMRR